MIKSFKLAWNKCCMALVACAALFLFAPGNVSAQNGNTVSGVISDANGPVIGAAVMIKDGTGGVTSDIDGRYTLTGAEVNDIIVFSLLGYETKEVVWNGQAVLDVTMEVSSEFLDEVVVTALGIKRSEKALSYTVQKINAEELTAVKDANFVTSLVGKAAGVTINAGSGPGSTTRVVMRGMKSIEKSNNVLYVIDGIPMYNSSRGGEGGTMESPSGSEAAADINPEDIESVNMLTGPSAAALYGSEAANGVIIINTKKGKAGKTSVTVSNTTTFSKVYMMPEMQSRYGMSAGEYQSWGAPLPSDYNFDPRKYFNTGVNTISSISLATGTEKNQTYISAASTNTTGIVPESRYDRYNFSARNTTKFLNDKLVLDFGASFIIQTDHNLVSQGTYYNPITGLYLFPRGGNFDEVRAYERWNPGKGMMVQYWPYGAGAHNIQNPYWVQNRNNRDMAKRRYMLNASLQYNITDWLNVVARANLDESTYRGTREYYASTNTTFCGENGGFHIDENADRTFYGDIMANIDKSWGDWNLIAHVGASLNNQRHELLMMEGDILIPNHFAANNINTAEKYKRTQEGWHDQTQSVFGSVEVSWKDAIFLTVTGRNEWASQLAFSKHSSFFYPSVGLSGVISNLVKLPDWFSFLKVRGSYSQVANPFERFISNPSFEYDEQTNTWRQSKTYPYYDLVPEDTKSWELGFNARFFDALSLDVTYYRSNTYHQTVYGDLPASSGYEQFIAQTGNVQNQGVELALGYSNRWGDFDWSSNLTFTFNENKIIELADNVYNPLTGEKVAFEEINKEWLGQANVAPRVILREGGSLTDVYVHHYIARDGNGNVALDPNGNLKMDQLDEPVKVGQLAPKANIGWSNTFGYKGLSLGLVITARLGGVVYSATQGILDYYGVSETSASARDNGGIPVNYGMLEAQKYYQTIGTSHGGYGAYYMYDATNVRLQELTLNYTFPKKWFNDKLGLTVGFVARNLAMIYCKAPFDPELTTSTGNNFYQGVDYFMLPSTRNFGFNVKLQF